MSDIAIRVENLGKQYKIGRLQKRHDTLRDQISDFRFQIADLVKRRNGHNHQSETPNHKSEIINQKSSDSIWALRDVSFEVKRGEVVGIIGRNGAGKSTLLKILSRITEPTTGAVDIYGRVASLLEVGTGFHPELTGRENIFLNGAILGMRKTEIEKKFDEIVAFAEVEKFIDTPVKRYSSGMYVRLAFAVAAHLEPEILVVDEVLAVGDAAFQKKCLGKMGDVAREGRTVLFVSHNMTAINQLCSRAVLLESGHLQCDGEIAEIIADYMTLASEGKGEKVWMNSSDAPGNARVRLHSIRTRSDGQVTADVDIDEPIEIEIEFWNHIADSRLFTNILLTDNFGTIVLESANTLGANSQVDEWFCEPHPIGLYRATCVLPANFLNEGRYHISVIIGSCNPPRKEAYAQQAISFNVFDTGALRTPGFSGKWNGVVRVPLAWRTKLMETLSNECVRT